MSNGKKKRLIREAIVIRHNKYASRFIGLTLSLHILQMIFQ